MAKQKPDVPNGLEHIAVIERIGRMTMAETVPLLSKAELKSVGISLNILYQAATCHRKCYGGGHMLERLCGRAYNLGCGAFHLLTVGFYDEALALVRSIGELSNIVILAAEDPKAIQEWINADARTLRKKFQPVHVRKLLEAKGSQLMYATKEWYGDLSQSYIHITPQTKPNEHSGRSWVGGAFQKEGAHKVFGELSTVLCNIGLVTCKWFKFDDLFEELAAAIRSIPDR
jgi:hypothetical protein